MLRPATPLAILLFAAFVLLLLSVISTPIVRAIQLASVGGTDYGVFGYCQGDSCSSIKVGYSGSAISNSGEFSLPGNARLSLSDILVVHPVACFLTLVCLVLAIASHFHSAAHSSRFLLGLIILMLPTLLITLLAFLVDVLLFAPHLAWGSWIVLAATILIVISGILTCAMRRTIVSRKARKKRIAENAEMSGENFYNRQNSMSAPVSSPPPLSQQPTAPMVNGAPGGNTLPAFATFENKSPIDDDRTPLNGYSRTGTGVSGGTTMRPSMKQDGRDRYGLGAGRGNMPPMMGRGGPKMGLMSDDGSPLPSSTTLSSGIMYPQRRPSNETMNSVGSRGRGRGGYPPRGYGRGGPSAMRGGPSGRGGMNMGAMAAGAGVGMMAGEMMGRGRGPPPGYRDPYGPPVGRQGPPPGGPSTGGYIGPAPGPGPYARRQSPGPPSAPGYGRRQSPGPPSAPGYGRQPSPGPPSAPGVYGAAYGYGARQPTPPHEGFSTAESPPPLPIHQPSQQVDHDPNAIGQAIEMNEHTGSPANPSSPAFEVPPMRPIRDSDSEVQGMVGLQQSREADQDNSHVSSVYSSQQDYVPPRAAWGEGPARTATPPRSEGVLGTNRRSPPQVHESSVPAPSQARMSSDNYYEDVDPRFADQAPQPTIPSLLMPGGHKEDHYASDGQPPHPLQTTASYDSIKDGPTSEASNFTSISERGVNPQWQAEHSGYGPGGIPNRGPPPGQQRDFLLSNNPDFELPSNRGGRGAGRGPRGGMQMGGMI